MAGLSTLCQICHNALYAKRESLDRPRSFFVFQTHHLTIESFTTASTQKCVICHIVHDNVKYQIKNLLAEECIDAAATMYRIRNKEGQQGLQFVVIFLGRTSTIETKFMLLPVNDPINIAFFPRLLLDTDTSSPATLDLALHWYQSCCNSHTLCSSQFQSLPAWLPSRLLDIGISGETCWRLVVVAQDGITLAPYATLSYRWGPPERALRLLSSTFDDFHRGQQRVADLPQTFLDAVAVVRRLFIQYLWIDALCIIQDSGEDKAREIPQMRFIYSNASCNLAASTSDNPHGGLFNARDTTAVAPGLIRAPSGALRDEMHHVVDMSYRDRQLLSGPLYRRGWVFQERLLSTRILYFGPLQIFWECLSELKCEGYPHGMPQGFRSGKSLQPLWQMKDALRLSSPPQHSPQRILSNHHAMSTSMLYLWNSLVRDYSHCALTRPEDRLIAFSGIASLFQEVTGDQYIAGLWRSNLLHLLDWWVEQPRSRATENHRAPSWSWASVDGPVCPRFAVSQSQFLVSGISVGTPSDSYTTAGRSTFAAGHFSLHLVGSLTSGQYKQAMHCTLYPDVIGITLGVPILFYFLPLQTARHETLPQSSSQHATEVSCLLLEPVICTVPVVYRRVGYCIVANAEDISRLGLQVNESGLASSHSGTDSKEIIII